MKFKIEIIYTDATKITVSSQYLWITSKNFRSLLSFLSKTIVPNLEGLSLNVKDIKIKECRWEKKLDALKRSK